MSARKKLNEAHFIAAAVMAAILEFIFKSLSVFLIAFAVLVAASLHSGAIRPGGRHPTRRR